MQTCFNAESLYSHLTILCVVKGFSFVLKGFPGLFDIHISNVTLFLKLYTLFRYCLYISSENTSLTG